MCSVWMIKLSLNYSSIFIIATQEAKTSIICFLQSAVNMKPAPPTAMSATVKSKVRKEKIQRETTQSTLFYPFSMIRSLSQVLTRPFLWGPMNKVENVFILRSKLSPHDLHTEDMYNPHRMQTTSIRKWLYKHSTGFRTVWVYEISSKYFGEPTFSSWKAFATSPCLVFLVFF